MSASEDDDRIHELIDDSVIDDETMLERTDEFETVWDETSLELLRIN